MRVTEDLFAAIKTGDGEKVDVLLAASPELAQAINEDQVSALLVAKYHGRTEIVNKLIATGFTLDIWQASAVGNLERVVKILAEDPQRVNKYSPDGFSPLGLAAFFGQAAVLNALLDHAARVNAPSKNSMEVYPLHSAAAHQDPETALRMVAALLAKGAESNVAQHGGWTPLHQAASHGHMAMVETLLAHGADLVSRSEDGRTAEDLAAENGFDEIVKMLNN